MNHNSQLNRDLTARQLRGAFGTYHGHAVANGERLELFDRDRQLSWYNERGHVASTTGDFNAALALVDADVWVPEQGLPVQLRDEPGPSDDDDAGVEWLNSFFD